MITTALAQLAQEISTQRGVLTTGIAEIQELFYGENGYEYSVMMDSPDGREQVHWVFRNSPSKTYQQPVTNGTWPGYLFGRNDWVVKWWQRGYQEDAIAAQKSLREGKEATSGLQSMTSEDLDALIDLPDILDKNTTALRAARKYFREGKNEMLARKQSVVNSEWDDDGSSAYMMSIGVQVEKLDACYDDVDVLDEANVKLAEAAVAVYEALAQIYIDEMKEAGDMFKSILSLPSDITNWRFWAGKFADLAVGAITRHAEDFKAKVTELGQMVDTERIVSKAQEIAKIDWPSPTGGALSGQG